MISFFCESAISKSSISNIFENSFQSNLLGAKWEDSLWYLKLIDQWKSESINENI